ncbi:GH92 family glycosyl hydrolase [Virgibacillus natechei]
MGKGQTKKVYFIAMGLLLLIGIINIPTAQMASSKNEQNDSDFFSSFEPDDPQPDWENTVERDSDGNKMTSGIDGNMPFEGIQGDITDKVVGIEVLGENPPRETKDKLIDRDVNSKWLIFEETAYIELELEEPDAVIKYALTSANDFPGRDPKNWELLGSNDGEDWTTLDTRTDEEFDDRHQTKIYEFENTIEYSHYRVEITANNGDSSIQLSGIAISNGVDVPSPPPSDMNSLISTGPSSSYTANTNAGWTGLNAFEYSGSHLSDDRAYSYNKVYDVDIAVTEDTTLSYYIHPEFTNPEHTDYSSTYAAVDLAFSDGTYLHDLDAVDQHGIKLNPQEQGNSDTLYPHQWNYKESKIGNVAEGKTIERILVAYDNPEGAVEEPITFKGHVDDIQIEGDPVEETYSSLTDYVDTLRGTNANGTFSRGNTIPAVAVPHGFNLWTPVTDAGTDSFLYAYHEDNNDENLSELQALSLSHQPSPWMGDRQTLQVMPSDTTGEPSENREERALAFERDNEIAQPHYYSVTFENGIQAEMTPTDHAAMFRFTFEDNSSNLIFDNINNDGGIDLDPENGIMSGYTDVKSGLSTGATRMFVYAEFDQSVIDSGMLTDEGRDDVGAYYKFDTTEEKEVTMNIATSLISLDQAKKNLDQEIDSEDSFETVKESAQEAWEDKLSIIEVEGATEDQLVTLYSNMYRLFLYPNSAYENVGTVEQPNYKYASQFDINACDTSTSTETCADIEDGEVYVNNGFWDTYRTAWPAYSLLTPTHAGEMIDGFVQHYRDGGWISRWSSPGYADLMAGTSANIAFADAYLKGVTNFDVESFYDSAIKDAAVASPNDNVGRKGMETSIFDGYTNTETGEGMSWALDGYINDFGIANLAKALSKEGNDEIDYNHFDEDAQYYLNRAQNYINMFDSNVEFFQGRSPSGEWRNSPEEFNPAEWGHDYTETNAWNMAFHTPQDGQGLANLYGGKEELIQKLDTYFDTPETVEFPGGYGGVIHEMREARDVRMGMYGFSNQPSHHILYMYNHVGQPWKTQEKVSEVMNRQFVGSEIGQGYPGDEDNGEMSAWYIFNALGFYPLTMGSSDPEYAIGAPLFEKATVHLENGEDIVINAPDNSKENKYVQNLQVNGEDYTNTSILHENLTKGATLDFEMGSEPSEWGTKETDVPESITPAAAEELSAPQPLKDLTNGLIAGDAGIAIDSEDGDTHLLFDNTSETELMLENNAPWIQYQFTEGKKEGSMYTLTSGDSVSSDEPESQMADPQSWVLKGSNDGEDWIVLDERVNETFEWRNYTRAFEIENPGEYEFYQLDITENGGHSSTVLAEIEILGNDGPIEGLGMGIQNLVENLDEDGEFTSEEAVHALDLHLTAVDHYENQKEAEKVVNHMEGFLDLLQYQHDNDLISNEAYQLLKSNADYMIEMWD